MSFLLQKFLMMRLRVNISQAIAVAMPLCTPTFNDLRLRPDGQLAQNMFMLFHNQYRTTTFHQFGGCFVVPVVVFDSDEPRVRLRP